MKIDIRSLKSGVESNIEINEEAKIDSLLLEENNILGIKDIIVSGNISRDYEDYYLDLDVNGILVLPCSVTLKPVDYKINIKIEGNSNELMEELAIFDKNDENTLDIFPIIWENILMEIPIRVVSEGAEPLKEGNGWKVIDENESTTSSPFNKLNDLL